MSDPDDRPQGDAVGGWHEPDRDELWDYGPDGHLFRIYDLDQLANERNQDDD